MNIATLDHQRQMLLQEQILVRKLLNLQTQLSPLREREDHVSNLIRITLLSLPSSIGR